MTNEEKARKIIGCNYCESIVKCDYKHTGVSCYSYGVAMKMATWKDEQFAEQISKIVNAVEMERKTVDKLLKGE